MKRKLLTERAAWVVVAQKIATLKGDWTGLCHVVEWLVDDGSIKDELGAAMHARIRENMIADPTFDDGETLKWRPASGFGWAFQPRDHEVRVLAALNLAVQAAMEGA